MSNSGIILPVLNSTFYDKPLVNINSNNPISNGRSHSVQKDRIDSNY